MKRRTLLLLFVALVSMNMSAQRRIMIGSTEYPVDSIADITFANVRTTVGDILANHKDYSIFHEALGRTGLVDSLGHRTTGKSYTMGNPTNRDGALLYYPDTCHVKFTLFAEPDSVFKQAGINSFRELAAKCAEWYKNASQWYDYLKENNITISTGTDYTNRFNVVNMFVAYHILKPGMPVNELVYERNANTNATWNFCFGYEPQEYYETLLPHTLLKVWETNPKATTEENRKLWINRYRQNNTLTDQIGTFGSDATHPIIFAGVPINRSSSIEAYNGYIHSINDILKYDENAVKSQCERMRFDVTNLLPEMTDNGMKYATSGDIDAMGANGDNSRVAFPINYFQNLKCYNENTLLRFCVMGAWRALGSDQFQGWGTYDYAIKLPAVPTGDYELRIIYPPMSRGGLVQYYLGTNSDITSMLPLGEPFDAMADPTIEGNVMGCEYIRSEGDLERKTSTELEEDYENYVREHGTDEGYEENLYKENDYGVASDSVMHSRGYMRAPASFSRGSYNTITDKLTYDPSDIYSAAKNITGSTSCRSEWGYGTMLLRRIISTQHLQQGQEYWLRIKDATTEDIYKTIGGPSSIGWSLDFIELVPTSISNNKTMKEDWY